MNGTEAYGAPFVTWSADSRYPASVRYLFGDSTPFPLAYNFLSTLEAFMGASTRIVRLEVEAQAREKQRDELAQNRVKGLEALEQFHTVVMRAVQDTAKKVQHQHALEYARAVADYATHYIEEHRQSTLGANERESLQLRSDGGRRAVEIRALLEAFLKAARLPVSKTKVSVRLNLDGKETRHSGTAFFEHPDGIATSFTVAPHRIATWMSPRKVSDFVEDVELLVGVEKSWLRGTVTPKQLNVDDWTIVEIDVSDEVFELVLRRKLTEKEALVFQLRRNEAGDAVGTVEHLGAPGAETLRAQDAAQVDRLWRALVTSMREVAEQKEQLLDVSIDALPVFENDLAIPLVMRIVAMFAPVVREIADRSPNEFELTLKVEADDGRREELYLRKEALVGTLQPLSARGREVFAPLGLDSWVPSVTSPPSAVMNDNPPWVELGSDSSIRITEPPLSAPPSSKKLSG